MKLIVHPLEVASVVKVEREVDDEPDAGGGDGGGDEDLPYCRPLRPVRWDERTRREPQAPTLAFARALALAQGAVVRSPSVAFRIPRRLGHFTDPAHVTRLVIVAPGTMRLVLNGC